MAIATVGAVLLNAAGLLNDSTQAFFTNAIMLPYAKIAYDELQIAMDGYQLPFVKKEAAPVTIAIGSTTMTAPTDMVRPVRLLERQSGSTRPEDYGEMTELNWDPHITAQRELNYWAWVGTAFIFPAATSARQVILDYIACLTDLGAVGDVGTTTVQLQRIHVFLQYRTAALTAEFIMQDAIRAEALNKYAMLNLDAILRAAVRSRQAVPTKRRPFRYAWNQRVQRRIY